MEWWSRTSRSLGRAAISVGLDRGCTACADAGWRDYSKAWVAIIAAPASAIRSMQARARALRTDAISRHASCACALMAMHRSQNRSSACSRAGGNAYGKPHLICRPSGSACNLMLGQRPWCRYGTIRPDGATHPPADPQKRCDLRKHHWLHLYILAILVSLTTSHSARDHRC
jgi:hypothetical protein